MKGWVRLHRSICDNPMWFSEPFTRAQAWVDLILLANHKPSTLFKRGIKVVINRGEVAWSEDALAERWMWSRGKVRRYLEMLKTVQQIEHQKNYTLSRIIIKNYTQYQENDTADSTTDSTNDKNDKNAKKQLGDKSPKLKNKKKDIMGWQAKNSDNDDDLPSVDLESGEIVTEKPKKVKREYKQVYALFNKSLGKEIPPNWMINKTQMQAADNLWKVKGKEKIEMMLSFYLENKDHEYCPRILSPYDLDSKWEELKDFKKRNNL